MKLIKSEREKASRKGAGEEAPLPPEGGFLDSDNNVFLIKIGVFDLCTVMD
jgi:hypothetical protein